MDGCRCKSCVEARDQDKPEAAPVIDEFEIAPDSLGSRDQDKPEDAPVFDEPEDTTRDQKTRDQDKPENAPVIEQLSIDSVQATESERERVTVISGSKKKPVIDPLQKSKTDKKTRKREEKKLSCSKKRRADGQDERLFFCPSIECKSLTPFEHLGKLSKHVQDNHLLTKVSCKAG